MRVQQQKHQKQQQQRSISPLFSMHRTTLADLPEGFLAGVGKYVLDDAELLEFAQVSRRRDVLRERFLRDPMRMLRLAMEGSEFPYIKPDMDGGLVYRVGTPLMVMVDEEIFPLPEGGGGEGGMLRLTLDINDPVVVHVTLASAIQGVRRARQRLPVQEDGDEQSSEQAVLAHALRIIDTRLRYLLRMLSVMPQPVQAGRAVDGAGHM
jgi:hypothetical protein